MLCLRPVETELGDAELQRRQHIILTYAIFLGETVDRLVVQVEVCGGLVEGELGGVLCDAVLPEDVPVRLLESATGDRPGRCRFRFVGPVLHVTVEKVAAGVDVEPTLREPEIRCVPFLAQVNVPILLLSEFRQVVVRHGVPVVGVETVQAFRHAETVEVLLHQLVGLGTLNHTERIDVWIVVCAGGSRGGLSGGLVGDTRVRLAVGATAGRCRGDARRGRVPAS